MRRDAAFGKAEIVRPGLERIREALRLSSHPERAFRAIHIAGTNGKGSTAAFVEAILARLSDGPVGLYTSPHLVSPEERIRVGGRKVTPDALRRLSARACSLSADVERRIGEPLSFFETMTWAAFETFRLEGVRRAVLEAGLGGRWDATSACLPEASVVTRVAIDHREWLGKTLAEIAAEKAGIIRPGVPVVIGRLAPSARRAVLREADAKGAPVWEMGRDYGWVPAGAGAADMRLPDLLVPDMRVGMPGSFQRDNAAVACAAAWRALRESGTRSDAFIEAAREGIAAARCPGRFMPLPGRRNAGAWTDGAHNPDAARTLARELPALKAQKGASRIVALWSMLGDKDAGGFVRALSRSVDAWVLYPLSHERAASSAALAGTCRRAGVRWEAAADFPEGWRLARERAGEEGLVLVCGSLVAVGDAYRHRVGEVP